MSETVLVTGASSGIGLELAKLFAADGSTLILTARNSDRLTSLAEMLETTYNADTRVLVKDLSEPDAPRELYDEVTGDDTDVDVLVNSAGFGAQGTVAALDVERQMNMVQVNVAVPTLLTRLFLPGMLARGRGGILNVASTAGFQPGPNMCVYFASKAYLLHFTEGLAEELSASGLTATCLAPGAVATRFAERAGTADTLLFKLRVMQADAVARIGYRGFRRGKIVVIPGVLNRLGAIGAGLFPRPLVRKVAGLLHA